MPEQPRRQEKPSRSTTESSDSGWTGGGYRDRCGVRTQRARWRALLSPGFFGDRGRRCHRPRCFGEGGMQTAAGAGEPAVLAFRRKRDGGARSPPRGPPSPHPTTRLSSLRSAPAGSARPQASFSGRVRFLPIFVLCLMALWNVVKVQRFVVNLIIGGETVQQSTDGTTWVTMMMTSAATTNSSKPAGPSVESTAVKSTGARDEAEQNTAESLSGTGTAIPDALTEVTFAGCCGQRGKSWRQVCLTEKACNSSIYPFSSKEEAAMFVPWTPDSNEMGEHQQRCREASEKLTPPTRWCQHSDDLLFDHFPVGCSRYSMGGGSGPYDRLFVFPQGKLAFCGVPKAGITQWIQFLRFTIGAKDYQSFPHLKPDKNKFRFDLLNPEVQMNIWKDPSWTKAIFIREPAERLLSAYLDKIQGSKTPVFGRMNVTFSEFVENISMSNVTTVQGMGPNTGLTWYTDPHWRPQAWSCGLSEWMPRFQYVGNLDRASEHTRSLLEQVGMWETFGKHYRVSEKGKRKGNPGARWPPEPLKPGEIATGFQQMTGKEGGDGMDTYGHSKKSKSKLDEYYTPELMKKVKELYWMDFALWDALMEAEKEGTVRGKDIAAKLNQKTCG